MPHSDIHGSKPARGSPWLFAACHVLHRLLTPRHPPDALKALDPPEIGTRSRPPDNSLSDNKDQQERPKGPGPPKGNSLNPGALTGNSDSHLSNISANRPPSREPNHQRARSSRHRPRRQTLGAAEPNAPRQTWWRRSDSNRRPEACKAPALPTELRPRIPDPSRPNRRAANRRTPNWWAREDLNFRPHAYQARALTN